MDLSGSMGHAWGAAAGKSKADAVADTVNRTLQNLVIRCAKGNGEQEEVRNYFEVVACGYRTDNAGNAVVGPILGGALQGRDVVPIAEIAANPVRVEDRMRKVPDGAGGLVEQNFRMPVWVDPTANGGTPMVASMGWLHGRVSEWVRAKPTSFPPVIMHITDGESTDGDPRPAAEQLKQVRTNDGNALLFNIHLSSGAGVPILFPSNRDLLPDEFSKQLFDMSSPLPQSMRQQLMDAGYGIDEHARGFVYNSDLVELIKFFDIGTRPANLR
ncbi:MAG: VWA domain-containing protein [Deltaproteobacteria bacterium]|nr:VWA domain-containing protein [Deltaproteobacteria bacterium]